MYFIINQQPKNDFLCFSGKRVASRRRNSPTDGQNESNVKVGASKDYILFSPTRIAARIKKAKLQQSLQNQSASVLTVPSGLDFSALTATLPQPGKVASFYYINLLSI